MAALQIVGATTFSTLLTQAGSGAVDSVLDREAETTTGRVVAALPERGRLRVEVYYLDCTPGACPPPPEFVVPPELYDGCCPVVLIQLVASGTTHKGATIPVEFVPGPSRGARIAGTRFEPMAWIRGPLIGLAFVCQVLVCTMVVLLWRWAARSMDRPRRSWKLALLATGTLAVCGYLAGPVAGRMDTDCRWDGWLDRVNFSSERELVVAAMRPLGAELCWASPSPPQQSDLHCQKLWGRPIPPNAVGDVVPVEWRLTARLDDPSQRLEGVTRLRGSKRCPGVGLALSLKTLFEARYWLASLLLAVALSGLASLRSSRAS